MTAIYCFLIFTFILQVIGEHALKATTLKKLGLTSGKAIVRLVSYILRLNFSNGSGHVGNCSVKIFISRNLGQVTRSFYFC